MWGWVYKAYLQNEIRNAIVKWYPIQRKLEYDKILKMMREPIFAKYRLYEKSNHRKSNHSSQKYNIEHVWCQRYIKNTNALHDLHHLYLADARENSLRNDYRYSERGHHRDKVYVLERRWRRMIGDTVAYFGIYYPDIFMEHMTKMMKDEEWRRWIRDDKFAKKWMIQRDMEIERIQGNGNPFLRYPILYVIFFEEWTWENVKKRMRETIRHQKMYYKYSSNFYKSARISSKDK